MGSTRTSVREQSAERDTQPPTGSSDTPQSESEREAKRIIIMAEADSGADLLWTTRNSFYVGAYQAAIADAADLEGLDDATTLERDAFVFRCYVELGSHEVRGEKRRAIDRLRD